MSHITSFKSKTGCNVVFLSLVLHCYPNSCRDYITSEMSRKHLHVEGACEIETKQFLAFIKCTVIIGAVSELFYISNNLWLQRSGPIRFSSVFVAMSDTGNDKTPIFRNYL